VGVEALAGRVGVDRETFRDVHEPWLERSGLIERMERGRVATGEAWELRGRGRGADSPPRTRASRSSKSHRHPDSGAATAAVTARAALAERRGLAHVVQSARGPGFGSRRPVAPATFRRAPRERDGRYQLARAPRLRVARRAKGTPREAIRILKRARDVAQLSAEAATDLAHVVQGGAAAIGLAHVVQSGSPAIRGGRKRSSRFRLPAGSPRATAVTYLHPPGAGSLPFLPGSCHDGGPAHGPWHLLESKVQA
jgi:hypothetical protein